ncbi:MAG: phage holin family protein [Desulfuromonadales bacterium]|nr:phage holin family protein [Desulfuromonadales bacterium]
MTRLILKWVLNSFALFFVMKLIPGIRIDNFSDLLVATLVLGLLNAFLRPLVILLTLPVTVLTLGLFTLVINGVMFYLAAHLVPGFHVTGFGAAFLAALLFSIFSFVLNMIFQPKSA